MEITTDVAPPTGRRQGPRPAANDDEPVTGTSASRLNLEHRSRSRSAGHPPSRILMAWRWAKRPARPSRSPLSLPPPPAETQACRLIRPTQHRHQNRDRPEQVGRPAAACAEGTSKERTRSQP